MEAGRSFASLFPISQNQIILQYSQQALRKQEQMRQREVQLQNQLQLICQRQRDAHRRNQDLLRNFERIEQELSLLAAKSDGFRRKQEKYKKQTYNFIPEQSKCAAPNSTTSTMHQGYIQPFNDFPAANYGNVTEPCHFLASVGQVVQPPTHFSVCPNQQLGLKGSCTHSMCSSLLHQHCDGQFGSFINPDVCKTLHSTLDRQTQKKKCSTKDLSTPENIKFIPNSKRDIIQQSPEFVCDKDNRLKFSTTPIHVHGHPLQWILTTDMYSDWQKKLLKDEQQQMAEERSVETTLERSKDNFSKKTECHAGLPNSISEYTRKPWDSAKSSSSPSAKHDNTKKGSQLAAKKRKKPKEKSVVESTPNDIITEQNKEGVLLKEQAISKADSNKMKLSLKLSNAPESLMGIGVNDQTSKCKTVENCDTGRIFSEHEINTIESSEAESVCEEAKGHPDPKSLCLAGHLDQHKKKKDTRFLTTFIKKSLGEFIESSEEDNVLLKGFNEVPENENLSRCSTSEDQNSLASIPSDDRSSAKEKSPAIEEQSLFRETVHHNLSLCASNSFVIKKDKMNGVINLGISEQASESSDESQIDVIKGDDGNIGMLMGQSSLPSPSPSENNNNGDIYGEVRESEKFREMLIEEIEKSSSEEDKESEEKSEAKSSVNEKACIFTVRERKTQGQVNIPEQSETEESGSSREDEQSVNDSQGTGMVIMDAVIHGDNKEEQGNTEDDGKCYLNKKKEDQTKCNTKKSINSEDEMSEKANISDEETLSSEDLDASDQMDSSEEEENTDFWGSGHEDIDEIEKDVELQSSSSEDSTKQVNVSAREEDPPEPATSALDVVAASCQDVIEDEEVNSEKQRSSWLCCLKTCSLPNILNKSSEDQRQGKRCSEDASMDMLQMHPVEFGTSLPAEEVSAGPITNVHTEDASAADTNAEDSGEESIHSKKESENHNEQWSDSEDNVHSFYD